MQSINFKYVEIIKLIYFDVDQPERRSVTPAKRDCPVAVTLKMSCIKLPVPTLCDETPSVYIGESKRRVRDRFNEHIRDAKNQTKNTPLGDHVTRRHPDCVITSTSFKISIERICKDVADLKIAESIDIRNQRPNLNIQTSSWPLLHPPPYTPSLSG